MVRLFKPQFAPLVESGEKRQTIRPTPKRMPKVGDPLSLRTWTGLPYRSKQRVLREAVISEVLPVRIFNDSAFVQRDGEWWPANPNFAVADGFSCWDELRQWFEREHGLPFEGILIRWD